MSQTVLSASNDGNNTHLVFVESQFTSGYSGIHVLGNTTEVCKDGRERARTALESIGIQLPAKRIILSITPPDVRKDGAQFDLAMALSLALTNRADPEEPPAVDLSQWLFLAELSLDGFLKPVKGQISFVALAMSYGFKGVAVASASVGQLIRLQELVQTSQAPMQVLGFNHLRDVIRWVATGHYTVENLPPAEHEQKKASLPATPNFDDMILSPQTSLLAKTLAAGGHSCLLRGSPGCGKSMFAKRLPSLLPNMSPKDHLDCLRIQSRFSRLLDWGILQGRPPYRAPHHHASAAALIGGYDQPGEIALAHGGVLFLDEFPEFRRDMIEALREPLESGEVNLSRAKQKSTWKSRVQLIAAANNCPCGWFASERKRCRCPMSKVRAYQSRISGPILDRIDVIFDMQEPDLYDDQFFRDTPNKGSANTTQMIEHVKRARRFAAIRNQQKFQREANHEVENHHMLAACGLSSGQLKSMIKEASQGKQLSHRSLVKLLRVARTLADLDECASVQAEHIKQAWNWRPEGAAHHRGDENLGI